MYGAANVPGNFCSICTDPERSELVNGMLDLRFPHTRISLESRKVFPAAPIKAETIGRHAKHYKLRSRVKLPSIAKVEKAPPTQLDPSGDLAEMVAVRAAELVANGSARVSVGDGLKAQALLDRRAEKAEDRRFMLNLAQLLSGGGQPAPKELLPGDVVEGSFVEADNPLLAPPELREP